MTLHVEICDVVLHVFLTSTDLCAFLVSVVVHFFQHLFSCEHGTHCISPSRLRHKSTLHIGHVCCVLFLCVSAELDRCSVEKQHRESESHFLG